MDVNISNSSNETFALPFDAERRVWKSLNSILYLGILPIVIIVGVCGNLWTAIYLLRKKKYLNACQIPYIFLCFGDCGTLLIATNNFLQVGIQPKFPNVKPIWLWSTMWCKSMYYFYLLFNSLSSGIICITAVDRYVAITYPFQHKIVGKSMMLWICFSYCGVFALTSMISFFFWEIVPGFEENCYITNSLSKASQIALQFYVTLFVNGTIFSGIIILMNGLIIYRLCFRKRELQRDVSVIEKKATITLLTITILYFLLVVPKSLGFTAGVILFYFIDTRYSIFQAFFSLDVSYTLNILNYANSALNWIICLTRHSNTNKSRYTTQSNLRQMQSKTDSSRITRSTRQTIA